MAERSPITLRERSGWVLPASIPPHRRASVFCFPYAGGGASYYRAWAPLARGGVAFVPVQPPGREERFTEAPFDRLESLVSAAADGLGPLLGTPYALFGHSMGALVAFELAHELLRRGAPQPLHLFVSGAPAPQRSHEVPAIHHLPREEFIRALVRYRGMPDEVLQHQELMDLMIPRLRADFAVTGTYVYPGHPPLPIPITAFGGADDETVTPPMIEAWREQTAEAFARRIFPGGHFFLTEHARDVIATIEKGLEPR